MGSTSSLVSQLLIFLGLAVPVFLTGMFTRRKTSADVQVSLSDQSLKWVDSFVEARDRAEKAARDAVEFAQRAAQRAERAEQQFSRCNERMDAVETHIRRLERILRDNEITPPTPPWDTQPGMPGPDTQ